MTAHEPAAKSLGLGDDAERGNVIRLPAVGQVPDAALVEALRARRGSGTAALFDRYHGHVRRVLVRVLGPDPELSDLVQEVFLQAIGAIDGLDRAESLRGWLGSIAVYTARGRLRRRTRWNFIRFFPPEELPEIPDEPAAIENDEAVLATYRVLDLLPVEERIVFALRFIDAMELNEVAEASDLSLSTVKRRLAKATARFASLARREPALLEWLNGDPKWSL